MSELSDYGAGVDEDVSPEDEVKIYLSNWLENYGCKVWWEKRPSYGYPTFSTNSTENPDLLVRNKYQNKIWLLEVKIGDDSGSIHRAVPQLLNYYTDFSAGEQEYKINGQNVIPDGFLLATKYAFQGKLYHSYGNREVLHKETWAKKNDVDFLPTYEYGATETVVRVLWQMASQQAPDATTYIGALLSDVLDGDPPVIPKITRTPWKTENYDPMALYYKPKSTQSKHQYWRAIYE